MKFTFSWLKDHLDTQASLKDISETLTAIGLEVESITDRSNALKPFTVAKILHAERHPEADKLQICRVLSNNGELQIVCGAPNARAGLTVALAQEGAVIPGNGMVIKKTRIRGVESNGMLCSASELGLSSESDGIIELPESAEVGEPIARVLGLDDPVIEIAITPNRADCLGVRGIARDLAAAGLGALKPLPDPAPMTGNASPVTVMIENGAACQQFIGCVIQNVRSGPSPDWLARRLEAIGLRPISALVDITNYLTFDLGRPLHVYDLAKLEGNITVRPARAGESLQALNGKDYALAPGMTVIADESNPLALGGIIGGTASGCTAETTAIFLEVALFDPAQVAQVGRALGIESDARYRFERSVDPAFVETGAKLAVRMILTLCGGMASALTSAGVAPEWRRSILLRVERIAQLSGLPLPKEKVEAILMALGCSITARAEGWQVSPPSWRADIHGEADLIEELLRINGYDDIPATPLPKLTEIGKPALSLAQKRVQLAKRLLAARGFLEACTWSFLSHEKAELFGGGNPELRIINPISEELDAMRPSLLPNLLEAARKNIFRGASDIALCEVGLQYSDTTVNGQRMAVAGIRAGRITGADYQGNTFRSIERPVDTFDAKSDALAVLQTLGATKFDVTGDTPPWYHPGRSGALTLGGKIILGYFGELHPAFCQQLDILPDSIGRIALFELFLDAIPASRARGKAKPTLKLSDFPSVERDFAFIMNKATTAAQLVKAIAQADKQLITDTAIFDVYEGQGIEPGKKSVAIKVTLQAPDRTLTESEIAAASAAIIAAAERLGGSLRQ